jgi:hypothetical protein
MKNKNNIFNLFIFTNSPGELSTWVTSIVKNFKNLEPDSKITVMLTPCPYASGNEPQVAKAIWGVDKVLSPKETKKNILSFPWFKNAAINGAVLFLGGDPMFSRLFSKKHKMPCYAYTEHKQNPGKFFKKVFYKHIDGDLMADRIIDFKPNKQKILEKYNLEDQDYCLFFAGSRPKHFEHLAPFLSTAARYVKSGNFNPILLVSKFISDEQIERLKFELRSFTIIRGDSLELISISKFLVALPGTNNAEAMYLRLPMLIIIPFNKPELLIFDGILGLLGKIPVINYLLNKLVIFFVTKTRKYYSLPNIMAGKHIVPELAAKVTPELVAANIFYYWEKPSALKQIKENLAKIPIPNSIAEKICNEILAK